ncbi:MAG TPA: phenylalanine--tRNA ligase subunit beta [Candidatus Saccharimonadales bacterium]|nr:phenylalanine--tRNA ligase subunit beta [Candidatus Saccharimonadales bacterium]
MKVSVNWLKQFLNFDLPSVDELVEKIGAQLGAVEEVTDLSKRYHGVVVVKVVECNDLEGSDHLHVCRVDDGGVVKDVERGDDGLVQVVCGAPNVQAGMLAAWLAPGVTVPDSVDTDEPFVLEARELRGTKSNGMLASSRELALGDSHEGILAVDKDVAPGTPLADVYKLDDSIIDIENKMFTHRPDCFGALGVAREIAGITGHTFTSPDWYTAKPSLPAVASEQLSLRVENEVPALVPRFTAVAMNNVAIQPSPTWLQVALAKVGVKSINNIVDLTNFYMLVTGQPLHAYDYDKVKALSGDEATLVARHPKPGEKIKLLNGKEIEPRAEAIMIATDKQLIGVGGVMGGSETEVDSGTTNIILEAATFDMYSIRRTSMAHGLFTEAVTRFTKGQSPLQTLPVLLKTADAMGELAGAGLAGQIIDDNHLNPAARERGSVHPPVTVSAEFINTRLGLTLSATDMQMLLQNVECRVEVSGDELTVHSPFWRTDIELREDVVEEVGRLLGYDQLPQILPRRDVKPATKDELFERKQALRTRLARNGATEVLTYSFVHGELLDKVGQNRQHAFGLSNALSPDLEYYRLGLTPSLLAAVHPNLKAGYDQFALFELGKVHYVDEWDETEPEVPNEDDHLALIVASSDKQRPQGAAYYQARKYLEQLSNELIDELVPMADFDFKSDEWGRQLTAPYEPQRSALIIRDDVVWGVIGEFKASVQRALKLPKYAAGFEVHLSLLHLPQPGYLPLLRFPGVKQDLTLKVSAEQTYLQVATAVDKALGAHTLEDTHIALEPLGVYQAKDDEAHKHFSFRVTITGLNRTLTDKEVGHVLDAMAAELKQQLNAERI